MAYRKSAGRADSRIFSRTATKTKKVNINPKISRGGICL